MPVPSRTTNAPETFKPYGSVEAFHVRAVGRLRWATAICASVNFDLSWSSLVQQPESHAVKTEIFHQRQGPKTDRPVTLNCPDRHAPHPRREPGVGGTGFVNGTSTNDFLRILRGRCPRRE